MSQNKSVLEPLYAQYLKERQYLAGFSPRTIKLFRWVFNRWDALIGEMPTKQNLKEWVIKLNESGIKPVTINSYARVFNAFLTWLLEEGHIPERIRVSKVKEGQKPPKVYSEETLHKLLRFNPRTFAEHRIYMLICVGIDTGCRIDELLTLRREGVDLDNLLITVIGKGDKARVIPISLECRKVLYKFLRIEDLRPYDLRHTFATRLVERGVHHYVISALLGHSTPVTGFGYASRITPGYAHATWDAMVAVVESLERPSSLKPSVFAAKSAAGQPNADDARKAS